MVFVCYYSSFHLISFNQVGNRLSLHPLAALLLKPSSLIITDSHTHSPCVTNNPFCEEPQLMTVWHQSNHTNVNTHGHLFLFHVVFLSPTLELCSPGCCCRAEITPSNATLTPQFTGAAGIWGPRPKPFIWGFEKSAGLVSSNALGDNGWDTRGGETSVTLIESGGSSH